MYRKQTANVAALAVLVSSCGVSDTRLQISRGNPSTGQKVYAESCAACHGAQLEGQPNWRKRLPNGLLPAPPHDASGHTWHHDDQLLFDYTKFGGADGMARRGVEGVASGMPAFETQLSDQKILDVLAFIRSTWPVEIQAEQARRNTD